MSTPSIQLTPDELARRRGMARQLLLSAGVSTPTHEEIDAVIVGALNRLQQQQQQQTTVVQAAGAGASLDAGGRATPMVVEQQHEHYHHLPTATAQPQRPQPHQTVFAGSRAGGDVAAGFDGRSTPYHHRYPQQQEPQQHHNEEGGDDEHHGGYTGAENVAPSAHYHRPDQPLRQQQQQKLLAPGEEYDGLPRHQRHFDPAADVPRMTIRHHVPMSLRQRQQQQDAGQQQVRAATSGGGAVPALGRLGGAQVPLQPVATRNGGLRQRQDWNNGPAQGAQGTQPMFKRRNAPAFPPAPAQRGPAMADDEVQRQRAAMRVVLSAMGSKAYFASMHQQDADDLARLEVQRREAVLSRRANAALHVAAQNASYNVAAVEGDAAGGANNGVAAVGAGVVDQDGHQDGDKREEASGTGRNDESRGDHMQEDYADDAEQHSHYDHSQYGTGSGVGGGAILANVTGTHVSMLVRGAKALPMSCGVGGACFRPAPGTVAANARARAASTLPLARRSDPVRRHSAMKAQWGGDGFLTQRDRQQLRWNVRQAMQFQQQRQQWLQLADARRAAGCAPALVQTGDADPQRPTTARGVVSTNTALNNTTPAMQPERTARQRAGAASAVTGNSSTSRPTGFAHIGRHAGPVTGDQRSTFAGAHADDEPQYHDSEYHAQAQADYAQHQMQELRRHQQMLRAEHAATAAEYHEHYHHQHDDHDYQDAGGIPYQQQQSERNHLASTQRPYHQPVVAGY